MKDIVDELKALRTATSKMSNVYEPIVFWNKGLGQSAIDKIQSSLPFPIPQDISKVYMKANGVVIDWEIQSAETPWMTQYGVCNLPKLDFLFKRDQVTFSNNGKSKLGHFWPDDSSPAQMGEYEHYFVLDYLITGEFVLIKPEEDAVNSQLYFFQNNGTFNKLSLNCEDYLREMLAAKAAYGWQKQFFIGGQSSTEEIGELVTPDKNYHQLLHERVAALKANPNTKKLKFKANPGVRKSSLGRIARETGLTLPDEMLQFYQYVNGFMLSWTWESGGTKIEGGVDLLPLENVIGGVGGIRTKSWKGSPVNTLKWSSKGGDASLVSHSKLNFRIESVEGVSKEVMIQFDMGNPKTAPQLLLLEKGEITPLSASFDTYINRLMETLGMYNWHKTLQQPNADFEQQFAVVFQ